MTATLDGILCPECGQASSSVLESRRQFDRIRRRRACVCGHRFTTWELRADRISASVNALAASRAARPLGRFQGLEQSMTAPRELLEAEIEADPEPGPAVGLPDLESTTTCEQCIHWSAERCGLGFPDFQDEGIEFARWCASFKGAA